MEFLSEVNLGQEYFINSQQLEDKIRNLLPSQGGAGAGFDLSASTQIIPVIDVTESAEGSNLRQDLQTALDFNVTAYNVSGSTDTVLINNTGYWRFFGFMSNTHANAGGVSTMQINDGTTSKVLIQGKTAIEVTGAGYIPSIPYDFIVKLTAGDSVLATASGGSYILRNIGVAKQIASIDGTLT